MRPDYCDGYQLVAGERRFRTAKELGLEKVPVVVQELDDRAVREIMLLENLQRENLAPLEEAEALQAILQDGVTQEELGRRLGKSQAWIANRLRLLQAPDELKDLLISREITPKHVLTLLPYVDYPVFKKDILPKLRETLAEKGRISVKALEKLVKNVITGYGNENVLCLDDLPWEIMEYNDYLDLSDCKDCKHTVKCQNWADTWHMYCLNRRCWKDKVNLAKQAFEKQHSKKVEKLAAEGEAVDLSKLNYSVDYHLLKYASFDTAECENCEKCKPALDGDREDLVCLDVSCYEQKKKAWTREQKKAAREEEKRTYEELDSRLEQVQRLGERELRFVVKKLTKQLWADAVKKALAPWGNTKAADERENIHKDIPEEELCRAVLRMVIMQDLIRGSYDPVTVERLERALEGLGV